MAQTEKRDSSDAVLQSQPEDELLERVRASLTPGEPASADLVQRCLDQLFVQCFSVIASAPIVGVSEEDPHISAVHGAVTAMEILAPFAGLPAAWPLVHRTMRGVLAAVSDAKALGDAQRKGQP